MDQVIVTEGLTRHFGSTVAVERLDLTVARGQVFGFLGPNGAGKTTTVRLLNGVLSPTDGRATVLGYDIHSQANDVRRHTGVLTETPNLYEHLTARENLRFFGDVYGYPEGRLPQRIETVLHQMGLADRADEPVGGYSKGMKQRLAIGRALLHEPSLLFLDEPTAGLDPVAARTVTEMIQQLSHQEGRTIFLCTHNLVEAQRLCDRVGVISQGVLRAVGAPDELARQLWNNLWVEIDLHDEPSDPIRAALGALPWVHDISVEGGKLRAQIADEEHIPDLVESLVRAGGRIYGVAVEEHSLEDVYFEIQGENHAAHGRRREEGA
jgi:ABC-2 type transport system ATP-binding protein